MINQQGENGWTALSRNWMNKKSDEVTSLLLKNGAKLDIPDDEGKTPLDYAPSVYRDLLKAYIDSQNK
jgi:ankyrin repeat protein